MRYKISGEFYVNAPNPQTAVDAVDELVDQGIIDTGYQGAVDLAIVDVMTVPTGTISKTNQTTIVGD